MPGAPAAIGLSFGLDFLRLVCKHRLSCLQVKFMGVILVFRVFDKKPL